MYTQNVKPYFLIGNDSTQTAEITQKQQTAIPDTELYYFPDQPISDFYAVDILKVKSAVYQTEFKEIFPQKNYNTNRFFTDPSSTPVFYKNRFEFQFQTTYWTRLDEICIRLPLCTNTKGLNGNSNITGINLNQFPQAPWIIPQIISSIRIKLNDTNVVGDEDLTFNSTENPVMQSLLNSYKLEDISIIQKLGVPFHQMNSWGYMPSTKAAYTLNNPAWELRNLFGLEDIGFCTREVPLYFYSNLFKKSVMLPPFTQFEILIETINVFNQMFCTDYAQLQPGYVYPTETLNFTENLTYRTRGIFFGLSQQPSILLKNYTFSREQENILFNKFVSTGFLFNYVSLRREPFFNNYVNYTFDGTQTTFRNVILNTKVDTPECLLFCVTLPYTYSVDPNQNSSFCAPLAIRSALLASPSWTGKLNTRLLEFLPFNFKSMLINFDGRNIINYSNDNTQNQASTFKFLHGQDMQNFFIEKDSVFPVNYYSENYMCGCFIPIKVTNQNKFMNRNVTNLNITNKQVVLNFEIYGLNGLPLPPKSQLQIYYIERRQIRITGNQIIKSIYPALQTGERIGTSEWTG